MWPKKIDSLDFTKIKKFVFQSILWKKLKKRKKKLKDNPWDMGRKHLQVKYLKRDWYSDLLQLNNKIKKKKNS